MSLDVLLEKMVYRTVFTSNITHNLGGMARAAGIYDHLWQPQKIGIKRAGELIVPLKMGIELMKSDPQRFKKFDAKNGWGTYEQFLPWIGSYLQACIDNPDADVSVSV